MTNFKKLNENKENIIVVKKPSFTGLQGTS